MKRQNFYFLGIILLIIGCSLLSLYSNSYLKLGSGGRNIFMQQLTWVLLGMMGFLLTSHLSYRRLAGLVYPLYTLTIILLILVLIKGSTRLGAQRWLSFLGLNFQPSEPAKITIVLVLAYYFSQKSIFDVKVMATRLGIIRGLFIPFIIILLPAILIWRQPDLGTTVIVLFIFIVMLFLSQIKIKYILFFISILVILTPLAWYLLKDYQKERLLVFINPNLDPLGAGYTVVQSKIAVASGGFLGKGWLLGTQSQLQFLPEAHTDFIFSLWAEEWGFLGSIALLFLYYLIIRQGFRISSKTEDPFGKLLAAGITALLAAHVIINISMTMGFMPIVGLPLPLMSYGGSSLITTLIYLGILMNIDKTRQIF